jgi:glycosyltransferase involved in cell wall biosynthesis
VSYLFGQEPEVKILHEFCGIVFCEGDADAVERTLVCLRAARCAESVTAFALLFEKKRYELDPAVLQIAKAAQEYGTKCFFGGSGAETVREVLAFAREREILLFLREGDEPDEYLLRRLHLFFAENAETCGPVYVPRLATGETLPEIFRNLPSGVVLGPEDTRELPAGVFGAALAAEDAFAADSDADPDPGVSAEAVFSKLLRDAYARKGQFGLLVEARVTISAAPIAETRAAEGRITSESERAYLVSCIIPVYNVEKYLTEAIESVLNQSIGFEENIELVLVNYGSTDSSDEICRTYFERYPGNIVYIKQENKGVSAARNAGLDIATGEYVAFLDGDDRYEERFLETNAQVCKAKNAKLVSSYVKPVDDANTIENLNQFFPSGAKKIATFSKDSNSHYIFHSVAAVMFERKSIDNIRFGDGDTLLPSEEYDFLYRILLYVCNMKYAVNGEPYYIKRECIQKPFVLPKNDTPVLSAKLLLQYPLCMIDDALKLHGKVARFAQYAVLGVLALYQDIMPLGYLIQKEEIFEDVKRITAHMDETAIRQIKYFSPQMRQVLLRVKNTAQFKDLCKDFDDNTVSLTAVKENNDAIEFSGVFHTSFVQDKRLVVEHDAIVACDCVPCEFEEIRFLDHCIRNTYVFSVKIPATIGLRFDFVFLNPDCTLTPPDLRYEFFSGQSTDDSWFKLGETCIISFDKNAPAKKRFVLAEIEETALHARIIDCINRSFSAAEYASDIRLFKNYLDMYGLLSKKKILLFADNPEIEEDRFEFLISELQDAGAENYFVIKKGSRRRSAISVFGKVIYYGSAEHKLLSLFAKKVISVHGGAECRFPFETVSHSKINLLYGGLLRSECVRTREFVMQENLSTCLRDYFPEHRTIPTTRVYNKAYCDELQMYANALHESNGGRYYTPYDKPVGLIADRFLYDTFKDAANMIPITPENWEEKLQDISFVLVTTVWTGLNGEWLGLGNPSRKHVANATLEKIISACRRRNIRVVFYSKEDPTNYARFISTAKQCDYVFTTCAEVLENYKNDCGHERVWALRFSCNPLIHNPVGMTQSNPENGVIFSGSWTSRYPERCQEMNMIFDGVLESGYKLRIVDRNFGSTDERYAFPGKYAPYITPKMDHSELLRLHKLYDWALNINTVRNSFTMFANRLYELEAAGSLCISNYSPGVNYLLPLTYTVRNAYEVVQILKSATPDEAYERRICAVRHAMTGNTCFDRFAYMLAKIGETTSSLTRRVAVSAEKLTANIEEMFRLQTYPDKELIRAVDLEARYGEFDFVAFFSQDMTYNAFYLEDMINGFKYTACDYVTKDAHFCGNSFVPGVEHEYVDKIGSKYRTVFWSAAFSARQLSDLCENTVQPNGYGADRFNYNAESIADSDNFDASRRYKLSVIVPVYNNGLFLYGKSFPSLRRSSMFADMEILLVDDGSTDGVTEHYCRAIARRYTNVRTYFFKDGGSGSASRPRNKGMELAAADYIAFLDPDNEAINDGYAALYRHAGETDSDVVFGNMCVCGRSYRYHDHFLKFREYANGLKKINDALGLLLHTGFYPSSLQDWVLKKRIITDHRIKAVEGAVGQDSFFVMQIFKHLKSVASIDLPIFIYYDAVMSSVVNNIDISYYRKFLKLQQEQFDWLNAESLLEDFMELYWNAYARNRIEKLARTKSEERKICEEIVFEIMKPYLPHYNGKDEKINVFLSNRLEMPVLPVLSRVFMNSAGSPSNAVSNEQAMVLCTRYPSDGNLYANMFVHSRVKAYRKNGYSFDVFSCVGTELKERTYEGVNVSEGPASLLKERLASGRVTTLLVHLMRSDMWRAVKPFVGYLRLIVWVHGAEVQPWHRRSFNFGADADLEEGKRTSQERMRCFSDIFRTATEKRGSIHFVFVSRHFAEEVFADYGIRLPKDLYSIVHNGIDTKTFAYAAKPAEQRAKILSVRPFANAKYANDLTVKAVLALSDCKEFKKMRFHIAGNGVLFDELTKPLRVFSNVTLAKTFYTHEEITALHREYGVFLVPTRMDSQGVSRDEAMSSGLVPVTNAVAAVPEFVNESCGMLSPGEDYRGLADAILRLYREPALFLSLSAAAAERVRLQSDSGKMTERELDLIERMFHHGG